MLIAVVVDTSSIYAALTSALRPNLCCLSWSENAPQQPARESMMHEQWQNVTFNLQLVSTATLDTHECRFKGQDVPTGRKWLLVVSLKNSLPIIFGPGSPTCLCARDPRLEWRCSCSNTLDQIRPNVAVPCVSSLCWFSFSHVWKIFCFVHGFWHYCGVERYFLGYCAF